MTHHAVEDIAVMRCLPNMAVVCPYSADKMSESVKNIYDNSKPCYLRMSRTSGSSLVVEHDTIRGAKKGEVLILSVGGKMTEIAMEVSKQLGQQRIVADVVAITMVKPFADSALSQAAPLFNAIVTIEEHSKIGGLGSAVAEVLAGMRHHPPLVRLGTDDCYPTTAMSYEELLKASHLDVDGIVKEVLDALR